MPSFGMISVHWHCRRNAVRQQVIPMIRRLLLCFLLLCSFANAEDLLPPSIAFKPTARALDGQTIEVRFEIAKG